MADPYLAQDESVILATDKVLFRSVTLPAVVLTNKRVLLLQTVGNDLSAEEILLSKLQTAEIDKYAKADPVLTLTYVSMAGDLKKETLTFLEKDRKLRTEECEEWVKKLNGQIVSPPGGGTILRIPPSAKEPAFESRAEPVPQPGTGVPKATGDRAEPSSKKAAPPVASSNGGILAKHDRPSGLAFPKIPEFREPDLPETPAPAPRRRFIRGAAIILALLLAVLVIVFLAVQYLPAKLSGQPVPVPVTSVITTPVPTPVTTVTTLPAAIPAANESQLNQTLIPETPLPAIKPTPEASPPAPQVLIPDKGVWVRVQYAGNFTGSVGVGGTTTSVSGKGDHLYQIVMKTGTATAIIQKSEGSADLLTVGIYRDGALVVRDSTTVPKGEVNIQVEIKAPTPVPTPVVNTTTVKPEETG